MNPVHYHSTNFDIVYNPRSTLDRYAQQDLIKRLFPEIFNEEVVQPPEVPITHKNEPNGN